MSLRINSPILSSLDKKSLLVVTVIITTLTTLAINKSYAQVEFNEDINELIKDGLKECSNLFDKPNCLGVVSVLDELCKNDYYPSCFGDQWVYYFDYMRTLALSGHTDYNDEYLNQNNEHFGNSSMEKRGE